MSSILGQGGCGYFEQLALFVVDALPRNEAAAVEAHVAVCAGCRGELETLRSTVGALVHWPIDVVRPSVPLWDRIAARVAAEAGDEPVSGAAADRAEPEWADWAEPEWNEVAPGITCKLLATDAQRNRVSMLVRLSPGVDYPPHRHAGIEELHLLDGELVVDDRTLHPGDYIREEAGTEDAVVRSETGCTCVLITSTRDELN